MRPGKPLHYCSSYPLYHLSTQGEINMDSHIIQSSYPGICQVVATLLLRVSSLDAGASIILLLPQVSPSGDGTYQTIVALRVKVEGLSIRGQGAGGAKEAFTSTQSCWTSEL